MKCESEVTASTLASPLTRGATIGPQDMPQQRRKWIRRVVKLATAACSVVAVGATLRRIAERRTVIQTLRRTATRTTVSAWP